MAQAPVCVVPLKQPMSQAESNSTAVNFSEEKKETLSACVYLFIYVPFGDILETSHKSPTV